MERCGSDVGAGSHLDLHDIAACWCSDKASADVDIILAQRTDVPRP